MIHKITYNEKSFDVICDDDFMNKVLCNGMFYEETMLSYIKSLSLDGIYLDIGAYIGTHSMFFSEICKHCHGVVSYEPMQSNYSVLENNVDRYYPRIKIKQAAVGDINGKCDMIPVEENMGMCYVSSVGSGSIPMVTIDDEFKDNVDKIGLIKIDVEGHEYEVLLGSKNVISKFRPHLFIEIIGDISKVKEFLNQFNYEIINQFNNTPTYYFKPI